MRFELMTLGLWDLRAAYCAIEAMVSSISLAWVKESELFSNQLVEISSNAAASLAQWQSTSLVNWGSWVQSSQGALFEYFFSCRTPPSAKLRDAKRKRLFRAMKTHGKRNRPIHPQNPDPILNFTRIRNRISFSIRSRSESSQTGFGRIQRDRRVSVSGTRKRRTRAFPLREIQRELQVRILKDKHVFLWTRGMQFISWPHETIMIFFRFCDKFDDFFSSLSGQNQACEDCHDFQTHLKHLFMSEAEIMLDKLLRPE